MPRRIVAGIMSGTSVDGIDVALVAISGTGSTLHLERRGFESVPYEPAVRELILRASSGELPARETWELDADLGVCYARAVESALRAAAQPEALDAIGLHGQTVYHAPNRMPVGLTVQLGNPAALAERFRVPVVGDFRSADVAAGGQGAPLVPYCDFALLHSDDRNRIALNIGGIANVTWLPHDARPDSLVAFDTGPGNMLIDAAMRLLYDRPFDVDGTVAANGVADGSWLEELLEDQYLKQAPPKSTGRERYGEQRARALVDDALARAIRPADVVATLTKLTASTIADGCRDHAARGRRIDEIIVGGGGALNATLMQMLQRELPSARVIRSDEVGLPADAKEAICFAILANETLCETPANVPSVTGARRPVICGRISLP